MIIGIISLAVWLLTIVGYVIYNLLTKNEKLEKMIENRDIYINNLNAVIEDVEKRLHEIDVKGTFASDD